jgi:hypothetical protein
MTSSRLFGDLCDGVFCVERVGIPVDSRGVIAVLEVGLSTLSLRNAPLGEALTLVGVRDLETVE